MNNQIKSLVKAAVRQYLQSPKTLDLAYDQILDKCKKLNIKLTPVDQLDIEIEIFSLTKDFLIKEKLKHSTTTYTKRMKDLNNQVISEEIEKFLDEIINENFKELPKKSKALA